MVDKLTWIDVLNNIEFESSAGYTEQFRDFYHLFSKEMKAFLKSIGAVDIKINRGHFYVYGFFTLKNKIWYFSLGDVRWDRTFIIREAKSYEDTGKTNIILPLENQKMFINKFISIVGE